MSFTTLISAAQLAANLHKPDWVVFDCRFSLADNKAGLEAYQKGHLPGARYVHLNNDLSSAITPQSGRHPLPDFAELAHKLGHWGVGARSQVVVYDDASGAFAGRLWWLLRCMGHDQVAVLDGGIKQWLKRDLPVTSALPEVMPRAFRPYLDQSQWLTVDQLEQALAHDANKLVDARSAERYQGLQEPIDPVAGHVPKALNRPFQENLDAEGVFLPAAQLRQSFTALLGGGAAEQVVHMCGSGVTACHNLLAMEVAGLTGSKLYAGSWSEWIVDPDRPVARL